MTKKNMASQKETESYSDSADAQDLNTRIQDLEERQRLIKDRVVIMGKNLIEEKEKNLEDILSLKKEVLKLKEENIKLSETLGLMVEKLNNTARREEMMIIQRQIDILRGIKNGGS